jgi:ADP-ribose pyrophosphatase YjhB (NUDIX family)
MGSGASQVQVSGFKFLIMQREYPERPFVGVGAIIVEDGRVALIRRGRPPLLGEWSIPGGALELGETLREAAVREAFEETGLTVEARELLGVFDRVMKDDEGRVLYHYVLVDFLCCRTSGELSAAGDALDAKWFTPEEIDGLGLAKDTAEVIRQGLKAATDSTDRH